MKVQVHCGTRSGKDIIRTMEAAKDMMGNLYVLRDGTWWKLSRESEAGWRSMNVGYRACDNHDLHSELMRFLETDDGSGDMNPICS